MDNGLGRGHNLQRDFLHQCVHFSCLIFLFFLSPVTGKVSRELKGLSHSPLIRVLIAKDLKKVKLSGLDLIKSDQSGEQSYPGRKTLRFHCGGSSFSKSGPTLFKLAGLKGQSGLIRFKNKVYQGEFDILMSKKSGLCSVVQRVKLDDYVSALLAKEMHGSWPLEALKAQAVAARSYALFMKKSQRVSLSLGEKAYYDLESSEKHQVGGSLTDQTPLTRQAARETSGQVLLTKEGELTATFFHSKCGGRTLRPDQVWRNSVAGYKQVNCPYCHYYGKKKWTYKVPRKKLTPLLTRVVKELKKYDSHSETFFGRGKTEDPHLLVYAQKGGPWKVKKSYLRREFGTRKIYSNHFQAYTTADEVILHGSGQGHGVGMCQYGAYGMAKLGKKHKAILDHYYPGHEVKQWYR